MYLNVLYSTGCPKCNVLKRKLAESNVEYSEVTDVQTILGKGIETVPVFETEGKLMDFSQTIKWLKEN